MLFLFGAGFNIDVRIPPTLLDSVSPKNDCRTTPQIPITRDSKKLNLHAF
jgi:hypothetical protein